MLVLLLLLSLVMMRLRSGCLTLHSPTGRRGGFALLAALLVVGLAVPDVVGASSHTGTDRRIAELRELIGEVSAQEAALLEEIVASVSRRQKLDLRIADLDGSIGVATQALNAANHSAEVIQVRYLELELKLREQEAQLSEARSAFNQTIVRLYQGGDDSVELYVSIALDSEGPHDIFAATSYLSATAEDRRAIVSRLADMRRETKALQADLDQERVKVNEARLIASNERSRLDALRRDQTAARASVAREEANERALLRRVQERRSEFERELASLQRESDSIGAMLRTRQQGQTPPSSINGIFTAPVNGRITSGFGLRVHPILKTSRMHNGIDYGASAGTAIRAAGSGTVVWAGPRGGYGNAVIIDHGNTLATLYAHQSRVAVSVGSVVQRGQTIGYVGSTGFSTGPHLHFEVRRLGTPVNPTLYL